LLFGVAGIAMARTDRMARLFLLGGGAVYLLLWIYGLVVDMSANANFVPFNSADNWLHLILGVAMIGLGLWLGRDAVETNAATKESTRVGTGSAARLMHGTNRDRRSRTWEAPPTQR
jgi:hypothetical protein